MNWHWWTEARAVLRKEWRTELRTRHGLFTAGLFGVVAAVAIAFAMAGEAPSPSVLAGMYSVVLLFTGSVTLPRLYLAEDEQRTLDLLRLWGSPRGVYLGKWLFGTLMMAASAALLLALFLVLTGTSATAPSLLALSALGLAVSIASGMVLCGLLAAGSSNRWLMASGLALPLMLPLVGLGVAALRPALGAGRLDSGWASCGALWLYALGMLAFGWFVVDAVERGG